MIRVLTLGGFAVESDGATNDARPQTHGKRNALLAFLAAEQPKGSHSRDTLLALFWPESDDKHARDALKQLVRSLRRDLGKDLFLPSRGNGVALDRSLVSCDAVELEAAAERGDHARVLELYHGDFLAGFHLGDSIEFEEWLAAKRHRLLELAVASGRALAEAQEGAGRSQRAVRTLNRVLEIQPYDEGALRALIDLYLEMGEPGRAVSAFETYAERLERELDAGPSAETVSLAERARTRVIVRESPGVLEIEASARQPTFHERRRATAAHVSLAVTAALAAVALLFTLSQSPATPPLEKTRILVDLFENQTGDPALDRFSRLAADHVTAGLTYTTFADVVTRGTPLLSRRGDPIPPDARGLEVAVERGAGTMMSGTYTLAGAGLRFTAMLIDVESGEVVASIPGVATATADVTEALEEMRDRVMAAVSAHVDPRMELWSRNASRPPTHEAYLKFVEGLEAHTVHSAYTTSKKLFLEAYEADSTFTMAALWAALAAENRADWGFADSIYASLTARRGALPPVDRYFLESRTARTVSAQFEALKRLVEFAPGSDYLGLAAGAAFRNRMPAEALALSGMVDPESGWNRGRGPGTLQARALEGLGRCEEIFPIARAAEASIPEDRWGREGVGYMRLLAHACLGDVEGFEEAARQFIADLPRTHFAGHERAVRALAEHAQALIAHNPSAAEAAVVDFVADRLKERVDEAPQVVVVLAELLAAAGRETDARDVLNEARSVDRVRVWWREPWVLSILEARAGNDEVAEELLAEALEARERQAQPTPRSQVDVACALCVGVFRAHRGDLEGALSLIRTVDFSGFLWWEAHHQPFLYGPLLDHPPFQELIAPRG